MDFLLGMDLRTFIATAGLAGIFIIIFAESGFLLGFFLPGDSLLFTAGILASQEYWNIWILIIVCFSAAVLGDNFGYAFGRKAGPKIFTREDSFFFSKKNVERAKFFYQRHGPTTLILARFVPGVRTFAPIFAGIGGMHYSIFIFYNVVGAGLWAIGLPFLGYYLGRTIVNIDKYLLPLIAFIVVISALPAYIRVLSDRDQRKAIFGFLASVFKKLTSK